MWWLIGVIFGTGINLREERLHPELRAKRKEEARRNIANGFWLLWAVFVALITAGIIVIISQ